MPNYSGSGLGGAIQPGEDPWTPVQGEQVRQDLVQHESEIADLETAVADHETRIDALEGAGIVGEHDLLSAEHIDTTAAAVVRGDLVTGQGATSKWARLAKGSVGQVLTSGATDVSWQNPAASFAWQGSWNIATAYVENDLVEHDGSAWIATGATTGEEPGLEAVWELFAAKGDTGATGATGDIGATGPQGDPGLVGDWQGAWDNGTAYDELDIVQHNGSSWVAVAATTAGQEPGVHASWELVAAKGDTGSPTRSIGITIDGSGEVITTGIKGFVPVPFNGTIIKVTLLSTDPNATAGNIVIDIWKDSYANYPPTVADTITASAKPTLSSANKYEDATLTGWATSLNAGDVLGFKVDSASGVTRVTLALTVI